ncbi:MAG: polysaccharide deacetylase family protein [Candidatus Thiodiazotropha lotti]|nr:polysaccharide deacetylase family protein [Candidatus Thiodiazotropha lotti]MCW4191117.1 polysaccharide deacetylase family protein [Candidatus Thiodiazotropha weberae]
MRISLRHTATVIGAPYRYQTDRLQTAAAISLDKRSKLLIASLFLSLFVLLAAGCSSRPVTTEILARDSEFIVLRVGNEDASELARRYLGDEKLGWLIEDANHPRSIASGNEIIIPLQNNNPIGFEFEGYQTVPILCYHRFGNKGGRLEISAEQFERQLAYLKQHDYRVIHLDELYGFLKGERALPKRSVVLTIDDGHRSIYTIAYPLLKKFNFPATVFVYSDYMNNGGLKTSELKAMNASGLISLQPHSKTHSNLALNGVGESNSDYRKRVRDEVRIPSRKLESTLGKAPKYYAYPFGDTNTQVIDELKANGLLLGLTVQPTANAAFTYPYLLNRSMIFGDRGMDDFIAKLKTFQAR